jgi:hypothetical protein
MFPSSTDTKVASAMLQHNGRVLGEAPAPHGSRGERLDILLKVSVVQSPFGYAQGKLFDCAAASLRGAATSLKMTVYGADFGGGSSDDRAEPTERSPSRRLLLLQFLVRHPAQTRQVASQ